MTYLTLDAEIHVAPGYDAEKSRALMFACAGWDLERLKAGDRAGAKLDVDTQASKIRELIKDHADPNATGPVGNTPAMLAAMYGADAKPIQSLIEMGGDVNRKNRMGRNPAFIALETGNLKAFQAFEKAGAELAVRDANGIRLDAEVARMRAMGKLQ